MIKTLKTSMKNISILSLFFFFLLGLSKLSAQEAYSGNGDLKTQVGYTLFGYGNGLTGTMDYGVTNMLSVGAGVELYFGSSNSNNFYLSGRANLHLGKAINMPANMDLYPGVDLGLKGNGLGLGGHLGYRYYFSDQLGVFAEIGSRGSVGLSINL
ncbi:DUF6646 family protein [Ornithobacterium rhinotracheale]|nr:DUF6646 family protein [Ornithobacterium rhinotracheale]MCK0195215.1 hypothetical protein [Ornithobacterium rhinotracheale]MCK0200331.1 hypothetical protein [Ornithobacterium rhinotracheale]MCK0201884.1 hypothetical protein [Ornithobacterium rhinotracheale]MCK0204989.1 hypothetical protein [Ornithobacterium rhinotracheale]UOH62539.1 hypothetical protein MT993_05770 [Ornithobacterium rhinotracheale]